MNISNPFNPPSSLAEQKNKTRARFRLAVYVSLGVATIGIVAMLGQGCKREDNSANNPPVDTNPPPAIVDTNPPVSTNPIPALPPMGTSTNVLVAPMPAPGPVTPVPAPTAPVGGGSEYTVVHGDSFYSIAKKNGVSMKAIEEANPGADPKKLKVGQKLSMPASTGSAAPAAGASEAASADNSGATYTVKSGDTLTRIAKKNGTTVKAIKAENNLTTDHIKVGLKLKIPVKDTTPTPTAAPEALVAPSPAPVGAPGASMPPLPAPNNTQPSNP